MASRQNPKDLRYDVNVVLASDSSNGSTQEIRIKYFITFSPVIKDKVQNTLPQRIFFHV